MFEESPIMTRQSGPQEPLSDHNISPPSPKLDKGKAKMLGYEDAVDNESTHSLDSEVEGFDTPTIRRNGAKKAIIAANEKLRRSTREKNPIRRFGYNDYMAYHYAFMMKVATDREPENFAEAVNNPRWVEAINEESKHLARTRHGLSSLTHLTRRQSVVDGYIR